MSWEPPELSSSDSGDNWQPPEASNPPTSSNDWRDDLSNIATSALKQTPFGMGMSATGAVQRGINKLIDATSVSVPSWLQKGSQTLFRGSRALGVGAAEDVASPLTRQTPMDITRDTANAFQPGFQPDQNDSLKGAVQSVGSAIGENAPVVAAGVLSPSIGGPLAMMAQQAQTGKVSPLPLAIPAVEGASKLFGQTGLSQKVIPPLLKATKGIPPEVTRMALENPEIMDLPGTSESIQGKSQGIIDAIKEASKKVSDEYGQTYSEAGLKNPVDEIINGQTPYRSVFGNRNYQASGEPIEKTETIPGYSYRTTNVETPDPGQLIDRTSGNTGNTVNVPARSYKYTEEGSPINASNSYVANTSPTFEQPKSFDDLRNDYHSAMNGDLFKKQNMAGGYVEASDQEKLATLTDLKRALQDKAIYPQPGQQLSPSQGAYNAAIKKMASDIDELRGTVPGGDKLAIADDAYSEMIELKHRLMSAFKDPYNGQDYLNRILKGNTDWLTSGRMAGKVGAIQRIEQITGKQVLQPALQEMAAAYLKNPDIMSLPSFGLESIISALVPTSLFVRSGSGQLGDASQLNNILKPRPTSSNESNDSNVFNLFNSKPKTPKPIFRRAAN